MDGIHDLGGMDGFGAVDPGDDAVFHAPWEAQVFGFCSTVSYRGYYAVDEFRHSRERLDPRVYLGSSYWGNWLNGLETLLVEEGHLTAAELRDRVAALDPADAFDEGLPTREDPELAAAITRDFEDVGVGPPAPGDPRFEAGEPVVVRNDHPPGHTRCPDYVRRARGVVDACHGAFPLADERARGREAPEPLYSVTFEADELWGEDAEPNETVSLDLWESYLEAG